MLTEFNLPPSTSKTHRKSRTAVLRWRPWGRGYAQEMAGAAIDRADRAGTDRPVVIMTDRTNEPSQRVARKLGFAVTGELQRPEGPLLVWRR
ncbi:GNAT family N-acetyltransferase [Saccharopolyspora antimicrobica]|uniref:GNAT family N-acetyltransferase n=1 Tax=Saccharopolyspora antimicrobica TaxID=455193 RepID=UPI0021093BB6|nr:GNAT family N-acetyltransferase [Saccharopolyspora antimicrobica]